MLVYTDLEFTGLTKDTSIISIACIAENGRVFYGEIIDYDKNKCNDWIKNNVIENLLFNDLQSCFRNYSVESLFIKDLFINVSKELNKWLKSFKEDIQFVSDVCHYDFVLLTDLITFKGNALDLPSFISPVCIDTNDHISIAHHISPKIAFDISREELLKHYGQYKSSLEQIRTLIDNTGIVMSQLKHNSLWDALLIKNISEYIRGNK